jgi:hypothetical protein
MATFKFTGTITVDNVRTKKDAINTLQIMLDDFGDMNSESDAEVSIHWDKVEKVKMEK